MRKYEHWIDGAVAAASRPEIIERHSPANGALVASFAAGNAGDIDAAVFAARECFEHGVWRNLPGSEKAGVLNRWADMIIENAASLAAIEAEESGKPITAAQSEIEFTAELARYAASLAWNIPGRLMSHSGADKMGLVFHEPRGVVAMITPWNYPAVTLMQKLPFALAAGCTVVIKPSEFTSGTTLEIAALAAVAGFPAGQINVVTGTGDAVGNPLCQHPQVDMISFTGSSVVGKQIARNAADSLKRVTLELGGKGVNIVFADADLDASVDGALLGFTMNQGEECCAASRLLIEDSIADAFISRLIERAQALKVGASLDEGTEMGPLIHEKHLQRVLEYIHSGITEGAILVTGGQRLTDGRFSEGCYLPPTIFTNVRPEMTIFREEIFGPVLSVTRFQTVDEAISIANDTLYGLANGVWSQDIDKALDVTRRLRSGMVYVNCSLETIVQLPFGGMNQSGIGRENGVEGLLDFMEVKAAFIKTRKASKV